MVSILRGVLLYSHMCGAGLAFEGLIDQLCVTRSAKTRHNCTSQNFQYKTLNAMGEILAYCKKILRLNAWFVEKEMSNNKTLDII